LISRLLKNFVKIPVCSYCEKHSFGSCKISSGDSSCCIECIRLDCSKCNVMSSSSEKLCNIAFQY
ncbi:hypothetical protein M406DRAFT_250515, partial [Cryphonectria parasitica EP155]